MQFYLSHLGYDYETKTYDIDRIATGVSTSQRSKIIIVRETLSRMESKFGKLIPTSKIEEELQGKLSKEDIDDSLQKLTQSGDIFLPKKGYIQKV